MKRVVVFAMVLMLGVVSVQAQWSVVPEAGRSGISVEAGISFSEVRSVLYAKGI